MTAVPSVPPSRPPVSALRFVAPVLLLALGLRLWGIDWGLPNDARWFSYHVDESVVVTFSRAVHPLLLLLDPGFYNYGSLSLLLNGFFIHLGEMIGLVRPGPSPQIYSASALLVARLVTVGLGVGTCGFLFGAGRLLYGITGGVVAATLYAVAPLAVQHGHFATVDVPATFWVAGSLYFAVRHLSDERKARDLILAGVWAGLAAATKYNMGLAVLPAFVAWWLGQPRDRHGVALVAGTAALGFLLGCPGALLNFPAFFAGLTEEMGHVAKGHDRVFAGTPPGFLYHIAFNLAWGIGWPLVIAVLVGVGNALVRRRPGELALLAFTLPYYVLIGMAAVKFARYTLPLMPPLFVLAGGLTAISTGRVGRMALPALGAGAVYALLMACGFDAVMTRPDPRDRAAAFIREKGFTSVGFPTGPWFYSPALNPLLGANVPTAAKKAAAETTEPRLLAADGEWNVDQLRAENPDAVALSELNEYADAQRIRFPAAITFLSYLQENYPKQEVFANPVSFLGIPFSRLRTDSGLPTPGLPTQDLPHDMNYTNPTTVVRYR
ncbi:MAG: glycosyltransferase family 39 protein [Capsulimonadales bacterium]|nr:glycosyltransferase family 39 protein [Capsulimonadales bacterium]